MKAQIFMTSIKGYDSALVENCWYKLDGPADDVKKGTIMLICLKPPRHTKNPQDYIKRPPFLRRIVSTKYPFPYEDVPEYLKSKVKEKDKVIKLHLKSVEDFDL